MAGSPFYKIMISTSQSNTHFPQQWLYFCEYKRTKDNYNHSFSSFANWQPSGKDQQSAIPTAATFFWPDDR
jgi:hypothetical protein